jgi:hypothetical protein
LERRKKRGNRRNKGNEGDGKKEGERRRAEPETGSAYPVNYPLGDFGVWARQNSRKFAAIKNA